MRRQADSSALFGGRAAEPAAAGSTGAGGRIAAGRAGSRAAGPHLRVAQAEGAGGETVSESASAAARREKLVELYKEVQGCTKCPLHETRTKAVFGAGNADADLMFVGEAP